MFAGQLTRHGLAVPADPGSTPDPGLDAPDGVWRDGPCLLRDVAHPDAQAMSPSRAICPESRIAVAFWGRLDNRVSLSSRLATPPLHGDRHDLDAQLILAAWHRFGERLTEHLIGEFVLAVLDPLRGTAFLARDPIGTRPLYYRCDSLGLRFATSVAALRTLPGEAFEADPAWVAHYLLMLSWSAPTVAYREVRRLPHGHTLSVDHDGAYRVRRWHVWRDDAPSATRRDPRHVAAYRERLDDAIRCRMPGHAVLGVEASGGLDSSTVAALLARAGETDAGELHAFSHIHCAAEARRIARINTLLGAVAHTSPPIYGAGLAARENQALQALGHPPEHAISVEHSDFYAACADLGIRRLYSGFGGDEVVSHSGYLAQQELADQRAWLALAGTLRGNALTRALRLAKFLVARRAAPAWAHGQMESLYKRYAGHVLRAEVVDELGLLDAASALVDTATVSRRINDYILTTKLQSQRMQMRLESGTLIAASYGVEYLWPLLDARLIQQYLSTPAIEKFGPQGTPRYLHRRAVADLFPADVDWRATKRPCRPKGVPERAAAEADALRARDVTRHPLLAALVDTSTLHRECDTVARGRANHARQINLIRIARALTRLDLWLSHDAA